MTLLEQFAHSELIHSLSLGEKILGSLYVAILGMSITFAALVILMTVLIIMSKLINPRRRGVVPVSDQARAAVPGIRDSGEELIAVLAAAAWSFQGKPVRIVRVRPLKRYEDDTPAWGRAGRLEQINGGK